MYLHISSLASWSVVLEVLSVLEYYNLGFEMMVRQALNF